MKINCKIGTHSSTVVDALWVRKPLIVGQQIYIRRQKNAKKEWVKVDRVLDTVPPFYFLSLI